MRQLIYNSARSWAPLSTGLAAGLTGFLSPSQFGLSWLWPGDHSETAKIPALFPALLLPFLFFLSLFPSVRKETDLLLFCKSFGLGKAALGLRRLTNQPQRIHQTQSLSFHEHQCNKMLFPKSGSGGGGSDECPDTSMNRPLILICHLRAVGHLFKKKFS